MIGLTFLANVVMTISTNKINRPASTCHVSAFVAANIAAQTLTNFFLAKLDDHDSLVPALQALTVLSKLATFNDDAAVEVYQAWGFDRGDGLTL